MKFTTTVPTEPGFYAWRDDERSPTQVIILIADDELEGACRARLGRYKSFGHYGEWCRLVPADEVVPRDEVKKAWEELERITPYTTQEMDEYRWNKSRAKRVAEGLEG